MTDFCKAVADCIAEWGRETAESGGDATRMEAASRRLRGCLDRAFPDSQKVGSGGDKVNYMLSSVFFLANRLAKASQGLAEFDRLLSGTENLSTEGAERAGERQSGFEKKLDKILAEYF